MHGVITTKRFLRFYWLSVDPRGGSDCSPSPPPFTPVLHPDLSLRLALLSCSLSSLACVAVRAGVLIHRGGCGLVGLLLGGGLLRVLRRPREKAG